MVPAVRAPNRKVLVLGRDSQSFLAVVRSLGRAGLEVHVAWCPDTSATLRSRYVARVHELPPYVPGGPWLDALVRLMDRERFDLVLPANETQVHPLQHHRQAIEPHGRVYLLDDATYDVAFDKAKTHALAEARGVRVPKQMVARSMSDVPNILAELPLPVVLKPRSSYRPDRLGKRRDVAKAYDRAELERALRAMFEDEEEVLVQENFLGKGVGVELLADHGEILFAFQHERVHEPLRGGGSSYRVSTPLSPELLEDTRRLIRALDYTGVAMAEFKVAPSGGDHVFLEINARFWGSLPLALAAGADFPHWLYQLLVEGRRDFPAGYQEGVYARNLLGDLKWMAANLRADRSDPTLATRPLPAVIAELGHVVRGREHSDTFVLDDPRPAFAELAHYASTYAERARARARATWLEREPGRAKKVAKTRAALGAARSVLFLCRGNICRSPFAHHVLAAMRPGVKVDSAGFYREVGRVSPPEAIAAARELGVDLEPHRSRLVTEKMAREAEIIVTFDEEIQHMVERDLPWAAWKTHRFGHLESAGPIEVTDPYGSSIDAFRLCYRRIRSVLEEQLG